VEAQATLDVGQRGALLHQRVAVQRDRDPHDAQGACRSTRQDQRQLAFTDEAGRQEVRADQQHRHAAGGQLGLDLRAPGVAGRSCASLQTRQSPDVVAMQLSNSAARQSASWWL